MGKYNLIDIFEGMSDEEMADALEADRLDDHPEKETIEKIQKIMYRLKKVNENMVADKDIAKEIKKLEDENPKGFAKEISRLKARQATIDLMKKAKAKGEVSENMVADEDIAKELKKLQDENPEGFAKEISRLKVRQAVVDLNKKISENMVADKDIEKEIKKLEDENPKGFAKEIKRLKARQAVVDLMKNAKSKGEVSESEEAVDLAIEASQEKAGIKENHQALDPDLAGHIEGLLDRSLKRQFLDTGVDLLQNLLEDDMFDIDDVISHLANELSKHYDGLLAQGEKLAGTPDIPGFEGTMDDLDSLSIRETEGKKVDFIRALKVDANGTSIEIKSYLESLKKSGDKFDSIDDYVEDFKNYVADKALQEHFKRFM